MTGQEISPFEFCFRRMRESSVKPSPFEQYDRLSSAQPGLVWLGSARFVRFDSIRFCPARHGRLDSVGLAAPQIIVHADSCVSPRRRAGAPHARHPWPARSSCSLRLGRGTQESCRANVRHQGRHATVQCGAIMGYVVSVNRVRWPSLRSLYKFCLR